MPSNVIEIVLRAKDEASRSLKNASSNLTSLKGVIATLGAGLALRSFVRNTEEAQQATLQLRNALKLAGTQAGLTESSVEDYAQQLQRTTTFSDEAAKQAVTLSLRLGLTGNTIRRVVSDAADLAAATGGDLVSATQSLARALADPERGMLLLRRSGIVLTTSQRDLIKQMTELGDRAGAQEVLFKAVEKAYRGAAAAATGSLGGALQQLKNAFGDLFEQTEQQSAGAVSAIKNLAETLRDPAIKRGIDDLAAGMTNVATAIASIIAKAPDFIRFLAEATAKAIHGSDTQLGQLSDQLEEVDRRLQKNRELRGPTLFGLLKESPDVSGPRAKIETSLLAERERILAQIRSLEKEQDAAALAASRAGNKGAGAAAVPGAGAVGGIDYAELRKKNDEFLNEINKVVNEKIAPDIDRQLSERNAAISEIVRDAQEAAKASTEAISEMYRQWNLDTETSLERQERELKEFTYKIEMLKSRGLTDDKAKKRIEEFKATQASVYKDVAESARRATEQIHDAFANMFANIGNGGLKGFARTFLETIRTMMANALATVAIKALGIEKILSSLASKIAGSGGSSGGSSGTASAIGGFIKGLFGYAGGGNPRGLAIVGEEGPELANFGSGGKVWNSRQLAFAGAGGGSFNFAPTYNVNIQSNDSDESERRLMSFFIFQTAKQKAELLRELKDSGVDVR